MIPELIIREWQNTAAPWSTTMMVEQDLIISRALVELYENSIIKNALVFRGGTALNKIYINPPARYSEDLDFVQMKPEPIGKVIDAIRKSLDGWLGEPKRKITERGVKLLYRFQTVDNISAKLKIEINTTEHYKILDLIHKPFNIDTEWFSGQTEIVTYELDELMGTKLRALYQRRKGRDLFDLWYVLTKQLIDPARVLTVFTEHCHVLNNPVTRAMFEESFAGKLAHEDFVTDMKNLIHPEIDYHFKHACELVDENLISKLPGDAWKR